jgi:hypothetical protein
MDRCAVFVDAGHLLAEGGKLCCGTAARKSLRCDYAALASALIQFAADHCRLPVLRVYWYDAAPDSIPTQEHLCIAELPNVKLRLGRLVGNQQKGVDSLIVRDLMTLARERAAATVFLLGGDEDLREGVIAAQEMGVLVVVLGILSAGPGNQAKTLIREADEHVVLETAFLSPFFSSTTSMQGFTPPSQGKSRASGKAVRLAGQSFGVSWATLAKPDEIQRLLHEAPIIPAHLDSELISAAEQTLGSFQERQDLRRALRAGFWSALKTLSAAPKI